MSELPTLTKLSAACNNLPTVDIKAWRATISWIQEVNKQASAALSTLSEKICDAWYDLRRILGESLDNVAMTMEELWQEIQDAMLVDDQTMPPREYGEKLIRKKERFRKHASYNYIPQVHRNLTYMRRRYS